MATASGETSPGRPPWRGPLILGAVLFFAVRVTAATVPPPPADPGDLLQWVADDLIARQVGNELKMFAALLLLAGLIGIARTRRRVSELGLVAMAAFIMATVFLATAVVIEGRLAYPIFGLELSADTAALVVSLTYGTLHAVDVMAAVGILAASLTARRDGMRTLRLGAGAVAGVAQVAGSLPWLTPSWVAVVAAVTLLLWTLGAVHLSSKSLPPITES